ncbi:hypothetical protein LPJ66_010440 [Kickxella alabastrina]|uniref:Uncharacterized protein n=1 Tax=Kickxella alabastrina TaxID=61397 RepID=A0ACC1I0H0_9FUNG|nr:hypothetical protein LPJ66_010440 [Kickxella alabastrina]
MLKAQLAEPQPEPGHAHSRGSDGVQGAASDIFQSPHLRMIFTFLVTRDWMQVLAAMHSQPLTMRLALALRHLDDAQLMAYVVREGRRAVRSGYMAALAITGVGGAGRLIMQAYVDRTGDVQTAALAALFDPDDAQRMDPAEQWIYAYRHLLNKWRMFTTRCLFDIARGNAREDKGLPRMSRTTDEIAMRPADVRCTFCHQALGYDAKQRGLSMADADASAASEPAAGPGIGAVHGGNKNSGAASSGLVAAAGIGQQPQRPKDSQQQSQSHLVITSCPGCSNRLPRCVVCRMTLGTPVVAPNASVEECVALGGDFAHWFSWCQTCGHGGHVSHMRSWFATHRECPISGCDCPCEDKY